MRAIRVLSGLLAMSGLALTGLVAKAADSAPNQVVVVNLSGELAEAPPEFDFFELDQSKTLHDLLDKFRKIKKDESVKAVVLTLDTPTIGIAQIQELRQAIKDLRSADKEVYVYLEAATTGGYMLATAGSRIVMSPTGDLDLRGIHGEAAYFKGLLDKIGVEADIEHVGAYKSAGEPYTRTEPSKEAAEMMNWLLKDYFDQIVATIAEAREMSEDRVRELIDNGPYTAKQAVEAKLIHETGYVEDFTRQLKRRYGDNMKLVYNYGSKKGPEIDLSNPFAIFKMFGDAMQKSKGSDKPSIGIIYLDGMILTGKTERGLFGGGGTIGSTSLRRTLNKARDDDSVKAVVLRIDSPGGSALASDIIWHAAKELADKKPLIVSMGNTAASGGYFSAMGSNTIFADPGTLTGSIGVVGGKIVTKGLWDWAGINFHEYNYGKNADMMSTSRKWDDRQREVMKKFMLSVYGEFADRVKKGRGDRLKKDLEELAGGRVYTGKQALALGLIDKLGGLQDAVKFAAASANLSDYETRELPEKQNFMDMILKSLMGESSDDEGAAVKVNSKWGWTLQSPGVRDLLPVIRGLDRAKANIVLRSLMRIELLSQEGALLVMPAEITIR